jgi:hypothetical protein
MKKSIKIFVTNMAITDLNPKRSPKTLRAIRNRGIFKIIATTPTGVRYKKCKSIAIPVTPPGTIW